MNFLLTIGTAALITLSFHASAYNARSGAALATYATLAEQDKETRTPIGQPYLLATFSREHWRYDQKNDRHLVCKHPNNDSIKFLPVETSLRCLGPDFNWTRLYGGKTLYPSHTIEEYLGWQSGRTAQIELIENKEGNLLIHYKNVGTFDSDRYTQMWDRRMSAIKLAREARDANEPTGEPADPQSLSDFMENSVIIWFYIPAFVLLMMVVAAINRFITKKRESNESEPMIRSRNSSSDDVFAKNQRRPSQTGRQSRRTISTHSNSRSESSDFVTGVMVANVMTSSGSDNPRNGGSAHNDCSSSYSDSGSSGGDGGCGGGGE
ncbi:hypothetical protein ACP3V5_17510 [Vibrio maritimus]